MIVTREKATTSYIAEGKGTFLTSGWAGNSVQMDDETHIVCCTHWGEELFITFAFDILAKLNGSFNPNYISSFHGLFGGVNKG